ncbi:MAG: InlB B-repeat-containing protein [Lachnospiraceae bacterium]|nr:InlB B-repeat-containing protein [Lachnospiraceae bacterium]
MKRVCITIQILLYLSVLCMVPNLLVKADTIYDSPYVSFSPDGEAWTTNAGQQEYEWYLDGFTMSTPINSRLRGLKEGEHYYTIRKTGTIPIGRWVVSHPYAECIHNTYQSTDFYHGIDFGKEACGANYNSGWLAYCADCDQLVVNMLFYMSKEAAQTIDYLEVDTGMSYFYICPHCSNLEQGRELPQHSCKAISWNQYKITYHANTGGAMYGGYMNSSYHMYNNETLYEGEKIIPATHLTKNQYTRTGYEFAGWNTKADGSGTYLADEAEIFNLTSYDYWQNAELGEVILYAQWSKSQSTLQINLNGGNYGGKSTHWVKQDYGTTYVIDENKIEAPEGSTIYFETNGGTKVEPITATQHFVEWMRIAPFKGRLIEDTYHFEAEDGAIDTIKASYGKDAITLPHTYKRNSAFGGWFYDKEYKKPAGGAGAQIVPTKDITLYAQWVDLTLEAVADRNANQQKGAVDLSWTQADTNNKVYLVYQSLNQKDWARIHTASDIGTELSVMEAYEYSGYPKTYTVPYTGLYTLTAYGAQGGNYDKWQGGKGGRATATFWLNKGEVLTYNIGGQNGYPNGGKGAMFANGGGATSIKSNQKGLLLCAGGGGGATSEGDGGEGGTMASVIAGMAGESGGAGGGGGYQGGSAGELIIHYHTEDCYKILDNSYVLFDRDKEIYSAWMEKYINGLLVYQNPITQPEWLTTQANYSINGTNTWYVSSDYSSLGIHTQDDGQDDHGQNARFWLGATNDSRDGTDKWIATNCAPMTGLTTYIPVNGNKKVDILIHINGWNDHAELIEEKSSLAIYNQEGKVIYTTSFTNQMTDYIYQDNERKDCDIYYKLSAPLQEGTTHIYIVVGYRHAYANDGQENPGAWIANTIERVAFSGGNTKFLICGMEEGQVISSKPAYGGSSYMNASYACSENTVAGKRIGNGGVCIQAKEIGYLDVQRLEGVKATDLAAPNPICMSGNSAENNNIAINGTRTNATVTNGTRVNGAVTDEGVIQIKALAGNKAVEVIWPEPEDKGTDYYHKVESYLAGSANILCESNITRNTIVSGIKGYYYLVDEREDTCIRKENSMFISSRKLTISNLSGRRFLHLAAVDMAGNISETVHIPLGAENIVRNLYTNPLQIEEGENVYHLSGTNKYYVRCDKNTPFVLKLSGYMDGQPSRAFQPNYVIYEALLEGEYSRNIMYVPTSDIMDKEHEEKLLTCSTEGKCALHIHSTLAMIRREQNRKIISNQKFILDPEAAGKAVTLVPVIGADYRGERLYSDYSRDQLNGLTIIGDKEPPVISGMDSFDTLRVIKRNDEEVGLTISARDDFSGLRELGLIIVNTDNHIEETYLADETGSITISITQDKPLFSGDFCVTAYAIDRVGNRSEMKREVTEFALEAVIERILEPHAPIFQRGESGILTITTTGYAERVEVEFPQEMLNYNPELNQVYTYTTCPEFCKEEKLQFMIPLYTPENENYQITVRAYKGDKKLEEYPSIALVAVEGSVLDDVRTRLR